jgi:hypothetical protein
MKKTSLSKNQGGVFFTANVENKTIDQEELSVGSSVIISSLTIEQKQATPAHVQKRSEVDGTVLQVCGASVECEVYKPEARQVIHLPKGLFPFEAKSGVSFTLYLDSSSGFRRPLIKAREPDLAKNEDIKKQMKALIAEL